MEKQSIKESWVDEINDRLWANRFDNSKSVANEAVRNLARAE